MWIEESGSSPETPEVKKCATPVISYQNGELSFSCETEGAEFVCEISDTDIKKHYEASIKLTATYDITVFAMATGYVNSDTIRATLCWIDAEPKTEGIGSTGVTTVRAQAVLVQSHGGVLTVSGAAEGLPVRVFNLSGVQVARATVANGTAQLAPQLRSGEPAIVTIGDKRLKVVVK